MRSAATSDDENVKLIPGSLRKQRLESSSESESNIVNHQPKSVHQNLLAQLECCEGPAATIMSREGDGVSENGEGLSESGEGLLEDDDSISGEEESIPKQQPGMLSRGMLEQVAQIEVTVDQKMVRAKQPERLSGDLLAQIAYNEQPVTQKVLRAGVAPKERSEKPAPAVWTSRNLRLQVVELKRPAPVSEKARRFRQESLFGGRIRRMPGAAFLRLQRKKAVRRTNK